MVCTLFVNVTGCLIIRLIAGWFAFRGAGSGQALWLFLTTGILGGYTTFSTFSLDTALLWERGQIGLAALYVFSSVAAALIGVFAGLGVTHSLPRYKVMGKPSSLVQWLETCQVVPPTTLFPTFWVEYPFAQKVP